jgi:hypothetical protein
MGKWGALFLYSILFPTIKERDFYLTLLEEIKNVAIRKLIVIIYNITYGKIY